MSTIETPRLLLRPVAPDDFDFIFMLQGDPELMRYIRPPESDPEVVRKRMTMWLDYARDNPGLGTFIAVWKASGAPVGNCVLRHLDYQPGSDLEVGYVLLKEYWGRGLATEITKALTERAFAAFQVARLVAVTDPDNQLSQKVLTKCGFQPAGRRFIYDSENLEFILTRPA